MCVYLRLLQGGVVDGSIGSPVMGFRAICFQQSFCSNCLKSSLVADVFQLGCSS